MKRPLLIVVLGLLVGTAVAQNRADACSTADNTSLGSGWTLVHCQGIGDGFGPGSPTPQDPVPITTSNSLTVGHWLVMATGIAGAYGPYMYMTDTLGNVAAGYVTTSGTAVTFSSGIPFSQAGCSAETGGTCDWNGKSITIGGAGYTISTVNSLTSITLTTSAGTHSSPVSYSGPSFFCTDTDGDVNSTVAAMCMAYVSVAGTDTISSYCHNGTNIVCTDSSRYVFIIDEAEISNTNGILNLDYTACPYTGCAVKGGHQGNGGTAPIRTTGSSPSVSSYVMTPGNNGELLIGAGGYGVGPIYAPAGYTPLIMGVVGGGTGDGCGGVGYCTNEQQVEAIVRSSSGSFTLEENDGATSDAYEIQTFALQAGNCPDGVNNAGYVRAAASGSASGADWTNAYTDIPSTPARGCTYYVATGSYGSHTLNTADSGTAEINIQAATIASHGTATGWSNAYQGQAVFTAPITFASDYWTFNGVYRTSSANNPMTDWVNESGYGFKINNQVAQAGVSLSGGSGFSGATCGSLSACSAAGMFVHDITISYVDINGAHTKSDAGDIDNGVDFEGGSYNIDYSHLYVHDAAVPFFLRGNHDGQAGGGYWFGSGDGNTVEYTYIQNNYSSPTYHSEGCSCSEGLTNLTWRYTVTDQIGGVGGNGATAHIGTASGCSTAACNGTNGPWFFYGDIFICTATTGTQNCAVGDGVFAAWATNFSTNNIYFLNNTIYDIGPNSLDGGFGIGLGYTGSNASNFGTLYSENNLWYNNDTMTVIPTGTTSWSGSTLVGTTWSYNAYFDTPGGAGSDSDANKEVSATNPFTNSGTCCFLIANTTAGTSTHSLVPGNDVDMLGNSRTSGNWNRGALQGLGSNTQPPAPAAPFFARLQ